MKYELGSAGRDLNFNAYADNRSIFRYDMEALPNEVTGTIGTSTAFAAWNAAVYVAQIEDDRLTDMTEHSRTLDATREVLRKHNGLWFYGQILRHLAPSRLTFRTQITNTAAGDPAQEEVLMRASYLFTSESVSEGHPDKVCDRISDEIVDLFYREGPKARHRPGAIARRLRNACHHQPGRDRRRNPRSASVTNDKIESVARKAIKDIGYEQYGFHWDKAEIEILLHPQSADIAQGVDARSRETRKKVLATRASCSAMPAKKRRT